MGELKDMSDAVLHELIENQLDAKRQAESEAIELTDLLKESLGEFYRRVHEGFAS